MLFDDHVLFSSSLELLLNRFGIEVVFQGSTGESALTQLQTLRCDLVLLDIEFPDISGLEVLQRVHALGITTPLLILTMYNDSARVTAALAAGARGYVVKSATPEELFQSIQIVLSGGVYLHSSVSHVLASPSPAAHPCLKSREEDIVQLLLSGCTNSEIGAKMNLSVSSVKVALRSLFKKFGVADRTGLAVAVASDLHHGRAIFKPPGHQRQPPILWQPPGVARSAPNPWTPHRTGV